MDQTATRPIARDIDEACKQFDEENKTLEGALTELFNTFPANDDPWHVSLKVVTLNALYSTQIPLYSDRVPTVWEVVDHICGSKIDDLLPNGSVDAVMKIAKVEAPNKDSRWNYSFATKYCNWHRQDLYPIYDARANECLWWLCKRGFITKFQRERLWYYSEYKKIVEDFRDSFLPRKFNFKEIDKYLYLTGGKLLAAKTPPA
jgi:hypothetical protein